MRRTTKACQVASETWVGNHGRASRRLNSTVSNDQRRSGDGRQLDEMGTLSTSRPQRRINTVPTDPDDNRVLGDSISTLAQISSAAFVERRATEEGVDPVQKAPHPSSRSLKEERTTTSDQHSETVH
jgi:hypothetical protein